jgi:Putative DNA-binding domain
MPTLLEVQSAIRASLVGRDDAAAAALLAERHGPERLAIYRNTFVTGATKALALSYPAVERLVGDEFFAGAAQIFIASNPPRAAWLDLYGADFPAFLAVFPPAAGLVYLPDVARLEWAVSRALHAADRAPLALAGLAQLAPADRGRVRLEPHPSISLLRANAPADVIWRAVLERDDATLAGLDLAGAPFHLLVERQSTGVEVTRLDPQAWAFASALCAGRPLEAALDAAAGIDATALLAAHLAAGRFVGFSLATEGVSADAE